MLEEILAALNWWKYPVEGAYVKSIKRGAFEVSSGTLWPDAKAGQYVRIVGSTFNDGVHLCPTSGLTDETFEGEVWVLSIPPDLLKLAKEIETYQQSEAARPSPYTAESFGGYSYSRAINQAGQAVSWKDVFASRLARWRKL